VQTEPEKIAHFNQFMAGHHMGMRHWLDVYPAQEKTAGLDPAQVFFVDVGGGIGHQSIALREKFPTTPNEIILQDIPATLAHAIPHPGVKVMVQDFFQPQEIKGMSMVLSFYFLELWRSYIRQKKKKKRENQKLKS
jgi:demethylsterigmatocystin 6-O-methyltransferase